jgi:hypothetical protein
MKPPAEALAVPSPRFTDVLDHMFRLRDTWASASLNLSTPHPLADPHIHASSSSERARTRLRAASLRSSTHAASSKAALHASKPILSEILDDRLGGDTRAGRAVEASKMAASPKLEVAKMVGGEAEIEEEPSHAGQGVRKLAGVGGADIPCPGKTQGPDAGACQVRLL